MEPPYCFQFYKKIHSSVIIIKLARTQNLNRVLIILKFLLLCHLLSKGKYCKHYSGYYSCAQPGENSIKCICFHCKLNHSIEAQVFAIMPTNSPLLLYHFILIYDFPPCPIRSSFVAHLTRVRGSHGRREGEKMGKSPAYSGGIGQM